MKHGDADKIVEWLGTDFPVSFPIKATPVALVSFTPSPIPVFGLPAAIYDFTTRDFRYYPEARYAYWSHAMYFKNEVDAVLYKMTYC
jgi:hypothetical protein